MPGQAHLVTSPSVRSRCRACPGNEQPHISKYDKIKTHTISRRVSLVNGKDQNVKSKNGKNKKSMKQKE